MECNNNSSSTQKAGDNEMPDYQDKVFCLISTTLSYRLEWKLGFNDVDLLFV